MFSHVWDRSDSVLALGLPGERPRMPRGTAKQAEYSSSSGATMSACTTTVLTTMDHGVPHSNIDRIAREGAMFTDAYASKAAPAGGASFILGQHPVPHGLLTIGMPGSDHGAPDWAPTIAALLKSKATRTGQFGKRHFGGSGQTSADGTWVRRVLRHLH